MDFSTFDFSSLDQTVLDETLAQLASGSAWEPLDDAWTTNQQPIGHATPANQHDGFMPAEIQGQSYSPSMLVNFHLDDRVGDKPFYNIEPWPGQPVLGQRASPFAPKAPPPTTQVGIVAQPLCCTWDGCLAGRTPFSSNAELEAHLESHSISVTENWLGPSRCMWNGCRSKETFRLLSSLNRHLENIHVTPLVCTRHGCRFKKPFRNTHDLQRHVRQVHSGQQSFRCPYKGCEILGISFAGKDKWLQHIQEVEHENDGFCPVSHCEKEARGGFEGFQTRKEISSHIFEEHVRPSSQPRDYSCGFGGCETYPSSQLSREQLEHHPFLDHGIVQGLRDMLEAANVAEHHNIRVENVPSGIDWSGCLLCVPPPVDNTTTLSSSSDLGGNVDTPSGNISVKPIQDLGSGGEAPFTAPKWYNYRGSLKKTLFCRCCECGTEHDNRIHVACSACDRSHVFCSNCTREEVLLRNYHA
ncbi:uncharacterized protein PAC_03818 [Phialocephala subalpina]|uniref:C2H2-type domain-containing protein n=1 Tax=Phialocephala subalpina TaxID=576137 RepID=A0A1L7WMG0_9HELO|nr:uncharacterized protein PAC_03818 [Phialocephala subalpina]